MKTFKNITLFYLLLSFSVVGCITSLSTQSSPTDITTAASRIMLTLSTPEACYTSKDTIPLELNIQNEKFDILVPSAILLTPGTFAQLSVTDTDGKTVEPKRAVPAPNSKEIFIEKDDKFVQCIQGVELKGVATTTHCFFRRFTEILSTPKR